jgi:hypothetical protein
MAATTAKSIAGHLQKFRLLHLEIHLWRQAKSCSFQEQLESYSVFCIISCSTALRRPVNCGTYKRLNFDH